MTNHRRQLITDLNTHFTKISLPYQCRKPLLSYGIWNPTLNMIEITHQHRSAAKSFLTMGIMKNSKLYLYPEEALFLMQSSFLQVSMNNDRSRENLPLSLDETYAMWFNQSLLNLHVYQYLTRIGFILIRHQSLRPEVAEKNEDLLKITPAISSSKRKRDEYENETKRVLPQELPDESSICPIHLSSDCQRRWFPNYTSDLPIDIKHSPRLIFPDKLSPIHPDWLPAEFKSKVADVQLSIYQNNIFTPRPSYSLLRSTDLQSHTTIYQRLSSFVSRSDQSNQSSSNIIFDLYTPRRHFRRSQPDPCDYHIRIKNGNDQFNFQEIYNEQERKNLTAVVHNGDLCFYSFKSFDPIKALQSK